LDQDSLGKPSRRVSRGDAASSEVWVRELANGSHVVGLFNRSDHTITANCDWQKLGLPENPALRDLWRRQNLPRQQTFSVELPAHGCCLLRLD